MLGVRPAGRKKYPVAGLGDIVAGLQKGGFTFQPFIAPAIHPAFPDDITSGPDKPVTAGVGGGVEGVDVAEKLSFPALIDLIHTPAQELGTPLGGGITGPSAVLGTPVIFDIPDFFRGNLKEMLNIVWNGVSRRNCFFLREGTERKKNYEKNQQN
jgi:hypothetical protein